MFQTRTSIRIVVIVCLIVGGVSGQQRRNRRLKTKPMPTAVQSEKPQTAEERDARKIEEEAATLSKLADVDREKLRATIATLQREIRVAKLGDDRLAKALRDFDSTFHAKSELEKQLDDCLGFLPEGITRRGLVASWNALKDARFLEGMAGSGYVSDHALEIIDKYDLEGDSLYLMSRDVFRHCVSLCRHFRRDTKAR